MRQIDSAIIGCGISGQDLHAPSLKYNNNTNLVAVCDFDEERADKLGREYDVLSYYDTESLFEAENLDSVHICTPPQTHADIAEECLRRDISVLIEKPLSATVGEADRIIEAAKNSGGIASVVHNQKFYPAIEKGIDRVKSGRYGDIVSITVLFGEPRDLSESERGDWVFDLPGGEIGEGLPHQVYLPLTFIGRLGDVVNVNPYNYKNQSPTSFNNLTIELTDADHEIPINIKLLTTSIQESKVIVHCTDGEVTFDITNLAVYTNNMSTRSVGQMATHNINHTIEHIRNNVENLFGFANRQIKRSTVGEVGEYAVGHSVQIQRYADSIIEGQEPPVDLEEGRDTIRVLEEVGNRA